MIWLFIFSLIYILLIAFVYFSKETINNIDNKIYKVCLIVNIVGILLDIIQTVIISKNVPALAMLIVGKLFLVYIVTWTTIFTFYAISIRENPFENKKTFISILTFYIISIILVVALPLEYYNDGSKVYSYGLGPDFVYLSVAIYITIMLISIIRNLLSKKHKNLKKYIPIVIFLVLGSLAGIIQKSHPELLLTTPIETFITILTYFFIENPDVKMIEQLDIAKNQAEKANQAKTEFLSSMSHEIRTPLNAIVGFSDYIMTAENLDEAKENAKDIVSASNTLLEIVNGILDISKIEAGKLEIVNSKYNAKSTFESLAKLITPKMNEKSLDFSYYIAPDIPETLFGDHANIKKVVTNLLSNAYKYTEKGSVRYEVNCVNSQEYTKLIITVEDTGRGIKKESIDKLFTKFQRLEEDRNTTIEGTGLGLAITKQLIELMGGKILVHTVYGEGSKFTVVLNQRIEKTSVEEVQEEIKTTLDLKDKRILIVDDNALNIKVATKILERFNANNVKSLDNGFACIDDIKSGSKYDIILMDDMMPKMSGVETFKKLKELPGFNMPVVILTANAISGMKEKYMSEGFDEYLAKPIEKDELIRVCNKIFTKYGLTSSAPPVEQEEIEELDKTEELEIIDEGEIIEPNNVQENVSPEAYLRENNVDVDKALEFLGDMDMYNMTINDFLAEVEEKWQRINDYKDADDMPNYAIEVHSLKSDAKYLGFMSLADIAYQHELKSKENDSTFVNNKFSELQDEYKKSLEIAKTYNSMIK